MWLRDSGCVLFIMLSFGIGCAEDAAPVESSGEDLSALEGALNLEMAQVSDVERAAALGVVDDDSEAKLLLAALENAGCGLGRPEVVHLGNDEGVFVVVVRRGACADGREAWLESVLLADASDHPLAHRGTILTIDGGEVVILESLFVEEDAVVHEKVNIDEPANAPELGECGDGGDVACVAGALSAAQIGCSVCKTAAGFTINQAGRACGWRGVTACAAMGLAGGWPGAICAAALWGLCKYSVYQLKSWGSLKACQVIGLCP